MLGTTWRKLEAKTHRLSSNEDVVALPRVTYSRVESRMLMVWLLMMLVLM